MKDCIFCQIVSGQVQAAVVFEDEDCLAFLDRRPLFPGHTLLVPRAHHETLMDLPPELVEPLFQRARLLAQAIRQAVASEGIFVGINNRVSQSVPHLHVHIVPRTKGDGLKGFFWPRGKYEHDAAMHEVAARIRAALQDISNRST